VDLATVTMDELHGILTAYDMRTEQDNPMTKEATFKVSKKTKNKYKQNPKLDCSCNDDLEEDEEVENFVRNMKRGTKKYKCMLPLNFFNCDGVGNFDNKCPYKNKESNKEDASKKKKKIQKGRRNKKIFFKKSIYTKDDSSLDEDKGNNNYIERVLFMEVEDLEKQGSEKECEEAKSTYKEELMSSIESLKREKKKNKSL
jgi:hypothetical protein